MCKKIVLISISITGIALSIYYLSKKKPEPKGIEQLIGNTLLIKINSLSRETGCTILAKAEFMNVGGSSKDRVALAVIEDAERSGLIAPNTGSTIFEGTVGSTGISLALIARAKGYKCHIVMPDDVAVEKSNLLLMLGATVEKVKPCSIVDPNHFVNLARKKADEMNSGNTSAKGLFCNQFENLINFDIHYKTTGPEIYKQAGGKIDAFVMGAGTGGTIGGVSAYLKSRIPNIKVVLADPQGSGLYNKIKYNLMYTSHEAEGTRKRHQIDTIIEGVGINRLTANFSKALDFIDDAIKVSDTEAVAMSRFLVNNDGIFVGSSSSVNCAAAVKLARELGPGHTIVTLLCDSGSRHLTKFWSDEFLKKNGINPIAEGLDFIK
ncbi:hypothetical protein HDV01_005143 [Terramyces sp. JEL0728]|nr:hypothetical protein HDV01_005143 [Terramyces sp. JEL0728]